MVIDMVVEETNAACNCFGLEQKENKVTPRRGHYQQYDPQTATSLAVNNFHICRISFDGPQWVVIDVVVEETNAACNCFGAKKENKVTPRRGHYQQYDP